MGDDKLGQRLDAGRQQGGIAKRLCLLLQAMAKPTGGAGFFQQDNHPAEIREP
jgi:hypothetical protein